MRHLALMMVLAAVPLPAAGQNPDSTRAAYRATLVLVRDSLLPVGAAFQSLRRDLPMAASFTIMHKAARLATACRTAIVTLDTAQAAVRSAGRPGGELRAAMRALAAALTEQCLEGLGLEREPVDADSVRAWVPFRAARVREAEAAYHAAAGRFANTMGFRIPPIDPRGR